MTEFKKIVAQAKICKNTVLNKRYLGISEQWGYLFAKSVLDIGKSVKAKSNIGKAPKPHGKKFIGKIQKSEYLHIAEQLVKFVNKNDRMKNYCTFKRGDKVYKIRTRSYVYTLARAIVYYAENKKLPNYVVLDTTVFKKPKTFKKYGHAIKPCADNRGQNTGYYCGVHSLQEVFRNLTNIIVPQDTLASVCGTTTDGTDHDGLNTGVAWFNRKYNQNLKVEWFNFSDLGWNGIRKIVNSNNQDCIIHNLYRNQWGHYEVINKIYDDYCEVQNSLGDYCDYPAYYGYVEERYLSTFKSYINGISQKSVMVITNE